MKRITETTGRRTAPSALRHGERERHRRALHGRRMWTVTATVDARTYFSHHGLAELLPKRMHVERVVSEDFGDKLTLHLFTSSPTPAPKPRLTLTNWRHAAP